MPRLRIAFVASPAPIAQDALAQLTALHGAVDLEDAQFIVALGGDGFMLQTLHATQDLDAPVYGMNRGTVGFLMNEYHDVDLEHRLLAAEEEIINPLSMTALAADGPMHSALAINEVSLLRARPTTCVPSRNSGGHMGSMPVRIFPDEQ